MYTSEGPSRLIQHLDAHRWAIDQDNLLRGKILGRLSLLESSSTLLNAYDKRLQGRHELSANVVALFRACLA